jgi:hypothetical protein
VGRAVGDRLLLAADEAVAEGGSGVLEIALWSSRA